MTAPQRIILTRSREQCDAWQQTLAAAGLEVLCLPMIRYTPRPLPADLNSTTWDWVLFTSPQAVRAFYAVQPEIGAAKLGTLGAGTCDALTEAGHEDNLGVRATDGRSFAQAFRARVKPPATVLLPGPERRLAEPAATLSAAGFTVRRLPLYRTDAVPAAELPRAPFRPGDMVFFASPSAVNAFAAAYTQVVPCAAIGETTARAARQCGLQPVVATSPDLLALCRAAGLNRDTFKEEV